MNKDTTVSNQQVNDIIRFSEKQNITDMEDIIKIAMGYKEFLVKNNDKDYYELKEVFENEIIGRLI
jgi:hypothetical protein